MSAQAVAILRTPRRRGISRHRARLLRAGPMTSTRANSARGDRFITPANLKGDFAAAGRISYRADGCDVDRPSPASAWAAGSTYRAAVWAGDLGVSAAVALLRWRPSPASSASLRARRSCSSAATTPTSPWPTSRRCRRTTHPNARGDAVAGVPGRRPRLHARRLGELRPESAADAWFAHARVLRVEPHLSSLT